MFRKPDWKKPNQTIPLSIHTHLFSFYQEWKNTPNPNRLKKVKQPLYTDKTFTKVNWSNTELKLNCADFQWSHQSGNTNKSQLFTHSARPLRNVPQEALTFVFFCVCHPEVLHTFYFSDNLIFLIECVFYNVVMLWYYSYKIAYHKDLIFPPKRSFNSALEVSHKLKYQISLWGRWHRIQHIQSSYLFVYIQKLLLQGICTRELSLSCLIFSSIGF